MKFHFNLNCNKKILFEFIGARRSLISIKKILQTTKITLKKSPLKKFSSKELSNINHTQKYLQILILFLKWKLVTEQTEKKSRKTLSLHNISRILFTFPSFYSSRKKKNKFDLIWKRRRKKRQSANDNYL